MRDIDRRLKALEAHNARTQADQGVITLQQWLTWKEAGSHPEQLPDTPAVQAWWQAAQARHQQCAELMAIFEA